MRKITVLSFALLIALLAGLGAQSNRTMLPTIPNAHASNDSVLLVGFTTGWNASTSKNPTITVQEGDQVSLTLKSGDLATHQFLLDGDNDGVGDQADCPATNPCSNTFPTASGIIYRFVVNLAPGTYTYYCTVHPTTMLGSFIVTPSTVGGAVLPVDKLALILPFIAIAGIAIAAASGVLLTSRRRHAKNP